MSRLLWPGSLGGRTVLVLLAAVVVVHLGSMLAYRTSALDSADEAHAAEIAGRLATATAAVAEKPSRERDAAAHALSSGALALRWDARPVTDGDAHPDPALRRLSDTLRADLPGPGSAGLRLDYADVEPADDAHTIIGALPLQDGSWLNFSVPVMSGMGGSHGALVSTSIMAAGVAIVAILLVRTMVAPLRALAGAADRIGRGPAVEVPVAGPDEVRLVSRAFNDMQARIDRLITDRTQALAAVSHDLRTPITRLRLRAAFVADPEAQSAVDADLDEMDAMIDTTLAYLRGDVEPEEPRSADLVTILATLVDAAVDAGRPASFEGPRHSVLPLRALAIKRAFANLIDNALTYGGATRVRLRDTEACVVVTIDDSGPGIPDGELDAVFEPFRRLDPSRNSRTGGVGLGLAIARQAILREGGTVTLTNWPEGGLRAEVTIPRRLAKA